MESFFKEKSKVLALHEILKIKDKNSNILDIGSGEPFMLKKLQSFGYKNLNAIDFVQFNSYDGINFIKFNFGSNKLPFKDESFDVILAMEFIEHIENPWFLIDEIHRVLKKGGKVIITTPNVDNLISKLLFLLKGRFMHFGGGNLSYEKKKELLIDKHRTPIFHFLFKEMVYKKFKILKYYSDGFLIQLFSKELFLPTKSTLFGLSKIYVIKK